MHSLFLICLAGGFGATALLALFGGLVGHAGNGLHHLSAGDSTHALPAGHTQAALPAGAHAQAVLQPHAGGTQTHATVHGHAHGVQPAAEGGSAPYLAAALGWTLSWLSPLVLAFAALWFGAGGLLADLTVPAASGPVAVAAAIAGAMMVRLLMAAFARADTQPLSMDAVGAVGVLNAPIRPDGAGEVVYVLEGTHRAATAKSQDGAPLPRGTNVVIVRSERGIAYVSPLDPLSALAEGERIERIPG